MKVKTDLSKIIMICALIFIMVAGYLVARNKKNYHEAMRLPFYNVDMEMVEDGVYYGKTYTSFMRLQLNVFVQDHKLVKIEVLENAGIDGETAKPILDKMIDENKIVVPAIKGSELGSLQYISCVSTAIHGLEDFDKTRNTLVE